jgi:hypothetical protein
MAPVNFGIEKELNCAGGGRIRAIWPPDVAHPKAGGNFGHSAPGRRPRFHMQGYDDLSHLALEADPGVGELRARLAGMTDRQLFEFGRAAAYMCSPYANLGHPPRKAFMLQLVEARAEWRRRHAESSPAA